MRWCDICQQPWSFAYCGRHGDQRQPQATLSASARVPCAAPVTLNHIYQGLLAALPLSLAHRQGLRQRGLTDNEIFLPHYRTLPLEGRAALAKRVVAWWGADVCAQVPGFHIVKRAGRRWWSLAGAAGLLIPVRNLDGNIVALKVRADAPGDGPKYTTLSSATYGGPSPRAPGHVPLHRGNGSTVRLTEGELAADVTTTLSGLLTVSIPGVAMWGKALSILKALRPQQVLVAFDGDWRTNAHVAHALGQAVFALVK